MLLLNKCLLPFFPQLALIALAVIKYLLSKSGIRYLVDIYGLDQKKLSPLNKQEASDLRHQSTQKEQWPFLS